MPAEYKGSLDNAWVVQTDQIFQFGQKAIDSVLATGNYVAYLTSPTLTEFEVTFIDANTGKTATSPGIPAFDGLPLRSGKTEEGSRPAINWWPVTLDGNAGVAIFQRDGGLDARVSLVAMKDGEAQVISTSEVAGDISSLQSLQVVDNGVSFLYGLDVTTVRTTGVVTQKYPDLREADPDPQIQVSGHAFFSLENGAVYGLPNDVAYGSWRLSGLGMPLAGTSDSWQIAALNNGAELAIRIQSADYAEESVAIVDAATGAMKANIPISHGFDGGVAATSPNGTYMAFKGTTVDLSNGAIVTLGDDPDRVDQPKIWSISDDGIAWAIPSTSNGAVYPFLQQDNPVAVRLDHKTGEVTEEEGVLIPIGFTTDGTAVFYSPAVGTIQGHPAS